VLVTSTTDPDWVPIMKRAAAIITDHGGRTSHAAIVSRELGLPAIVGTGDATHVLHDQQEVTVSCAGGEQGDIYEGISISMSKTSSRPCAADQNENHAEPRRSVLGVPLVAPAVADGVGLARMEFVVNSAVQVHPMALVNFDTLHDDHDKRDRSADARLR
jgi:pyruvate,water dikinase